ncbi:hypothetical protein X975_05021, partial [Stegodyphus mimosarum]
MTEKLSCLQDDFEDAPQPLSPLALFFEYECLECFEEITAQTNFYSVQ